MAPTQFPRWISPILGVVPETTSQSQICVRVRDLVDVLAVRLPAVRTAPGMVAVNHSYVGADFTLHDGDEAAFIPPVSGGR